MSEKQVLGWGVQNAPASRTTADSEVFTLLAVNANFDGTAAAASFLPCVEIISDAGQVVARTITDSAVAAGGSAEVTFAPFLSRGGTSSSTPIPPATELDYAEPPAGTLTITATSAATAQQWIVGNQITLDGSTRIQIEVWIALAGTDHDCVAELYDNGADVSRIAQVSVTPAGALTSSLTLYGIALITPTAGAHTYEIRAWKSAGSTSTFLNPTPFPFNIFAPSFYRITAA